MSPLQLLRLLWKLLVRISHKNQANSLQRPSSWETKEDMKRGGTDVQNIEYVETCKAIRRRMAEEIRSYNEERQLQALKNNNGLKSIKRKQVLGRNNIVSLKERTEHSSETSTGWYKDVISSTPSCTAPGRLDNLVSSHYQAPVSRLPQSYHQKWE